MDACDAKARSMDFCGQNEIAEAHASGGLAAASALLRGAGNGLLTLAEGTLSLALHGPAGD